MRRIYFDVCALHRPFDDQGDELVRWQASTLLLLLSQAEDGVLEFVSSDAVMLEIDLMPDSASRSAVRALAGVATSRAPIPQDAVEAACGIAALGILPMDALHLACATLCGAEMLISTDDQMDARKAYAKAISTEFPDAPAAVHQAPPQSQTADQLESILAQIPSGALEGLAARPGPIGAARRAQLAGGGTGNYTLDRRRWLDGLSVPELMKRLPPGC